MPSQEAQYLRQCLKEMGNPQLGPWGLKAKCQWKLADPERFQALQKTGTLILTLRVEAEEARQSFGQMVEQGMNPNSAKELAMADLMWTERDQEYEAFVTEMQQGEGEANSLDAMDAMLKDEEQQRSAQRGRVRSLGDVD